MTLEWLSRADGQNKLRPLEKDARTPDPYPLNLLVKIICFCRGHAYTMLERWNVNTLRAIKTCMRLMASHKSLIKTCGLEVV